MEMGKSREKGFANIKSALYSDSVLRHYDPDAELVLQCDASSIAVGAVLLQPGADGSLELVAYVSRTLNQAEQNYSQIERESLAIVFDATQFREYLLGRYFKLLTDHKPLMTLLGEHKPVPQLASARIKRLLATTTYNLFQVKIMYIQIFYPEKGEPSTSEQVTVKVMFPEGEQIVNSNMVSMETKKDKVLS